MRIRDFGAGLCVTWVQTRVNSLDNQSYNCKVQTHYLLQLSTTKEEEGFNPHQVNKRNNYFHRFYSIPLHLYGVLGKNHLADGYRAMEIMSWSSKASLLQASKLVFSPISILQSLRSYGNCIKGLIATFHHV